MLPRLWLFDSARRFLAEWFPSSFAYGGPSFWWCQMATAEISTTIEPAWLTVQQSARYSSLSPETIRKLIRDGKLPASRPVAGRLVISREKLDEFLRGKSV